MLKGGNTLKERVSVMTSLSTNILHHAPSFLRQTGAGIMNFLVQLAEFSSTYRRIEYYNALSDEQLAEMGMTRSDVVQKVFGGRAHL